MIRMIVWVSRLLGALCALAEIVVRIKILEDGSVISMVSVRVR